ncbi:hypothetical protein BVwin_12940 [Bartonella vinsonii subsp. berkhoffii str. Winnie]|nr:hypothetical protein BVwin_12940 [Bartonella vinsonii subsp. berkhoffii str. Winnie]
MKHQSPPNLPAYLLQQTNACPPKTAKTQPLKHKSFTYLDLKTVHGNFPAPMNILKTLNSSHSPHPMHDLPQQCKTQDTPPPPPNLPAYLLQQTNACPPKTAKTQPLKHKSLKHLDLKTVHGNFPAPMNILKNLKTDYILLTCIGSLHIYWFKVSLQSCCCTIFTHTETQCFIVLSRNVSLCDSTREKSFRR